MSVTEQKAYRVFPSVVAPIVLICIAVYFGFTRDYWLLCSIPFIVLGSICAAPNLNLADGCLVMIAIVIGVAVAALLFRRLGEAIVAGSFAGWIGGAIEKRIRMRPA
jgi:hypothetical protein